MGIPVKTSKEFAGHTNSWEVAPPPHFRMWYCIKVMLGLFPPGLPSRVKWLMNFQRVVLGREVPFKRCFWPKSGTVAWTVHPFWTSQCQSRDEINLVGTSYALIIANVAQTLPIHELPSLLDVHVLGLNLVVCPRDRRSNE